MRTRLIYPFHNLSSSLIVFFLLLFNSCTIQQGFIPDVLKTDLQKENLKGKVSFLRVLTFEGDNSKDSNDYEMSIWPESSYDLLFDKNGQAINRIYYNKGDILLKIMLTVHRIHRFI